MLRPKCCGCKENALWLFTVPTTLSLTFRVCVLSNFTTLQKKELPSYFKTSLTTHNTQLQQATTPRPVPPQRGPRPRPTTPPLKIPDLRPAGPLLVFPGGSTEVRQDVGAEAPQNRDYLASCSWIWAMPLLAGFAFKMFEMLLLPTFKKCTLQIKMTIYVPSVRYVDIAAWIIVLAVPHNSCGRSSSETHVLDGNQSLWRIWKQWWLFFVTCMSPWTAVPWFDSHEYHEWRWSGQEMHLKKTISIFFWSSLFTSERGRFFLNKSVWWSIDAIWLIW